jgi:3-hydroxyacyl-[acyl-carrier-protein] dehydratase
VANNVTTMDHSAIRNYLPHRYPFLLIDKVTDIQLGHAITVVKNVTCNEPFFQGHFPHQAVMPGVLIIEAMAQATGVLSFKTTDTKPTDGENYFLAGVNEARFKRIVAPGDTLIIRVELLKKRRDIGQFKCTAHVDDELACTAELLTARRKIAL